MTPPSTPESSLIADTEDKTTLSGHPFELQNRGGKICAGWANLAKFEIDHKELLRLAFRGSVGLAKFVLRQAIPAITAAVVSWFATTGTLPAHAGPTAIWSATRAAPAAFAEHPEPAMRTLLGSEDAGCH